MRQYHDAEKEGVSAEFTTFSFHVVGRLALILGTLIILVLLLYSRFSGTLGILAAILTGGLIYPQGNLALQNALLVTQGRQKIANIIRFFMQCGVLFSIAAGAVLISQSGTVLLLAELVFIWGLWGITRALVRFKPRPNQSAKREQAWTEESKAFVKPLVAVGVFSWALSVADRYILEFFWSPAEVGTYSAVYALGSQPILLATGISAQLVYPFLFRAAAQKDGPTQTILGRYVGAATIMAAGAVLITIGLFGPDIVSLLLAERYRSEAHKLLLWIAGGYAALSIASVFELGAYATKRTSIMAVAYGIAACVNVGLNLVWVPSGGTMAAAQATCFGFLSYLVVIATMSTVLRCHKTKAC